MALTILEMDMGIRVTWKLAFHKIIEMGIHWVF